jgi:hypothetical protein
MIVTIHMEVMDRAIKPSPETWRARKTKRMFWITALFLHIYPTNYMLSFDTCTVPQTNKGGLSKIPLHGT